MEIMGIERWDSFVEFLEDLKNKYYYNMIDLDGNGYIDLSELKAALDIVGFKLPQWQVRQMIEDWDKSTDGPGKGKLSFSEFQNVRNILIVFFPAGTVIDSDGCKCTLS
ncbi:Plastin-3 [Halocaridina rubra]|uniref:Plastin-3 n=1 Tax=Halocaridina rubra TaxID=373956 RepID=A0AAN8WMA5_HALRR